MASRRKILVVIDEFPYLLGTTSAEQQRALSSIQAVMERKCDESKLKLVLTGSTISQMEDLQAEEPAARTPDAAAAVADDLRRGHHDAHRP